MRRRDNVLQVNLDRLEPFYAKVSKVVQCAPAFHCSQLNQWFFDAYVRKYNCEEACTLRTVSNLGRSLLARQTTIKKGKQKHKSLSIPFRSGHWPGRATFVGFRLNASSGMEVADHSKNTFLELKRKKLHRYVIFKIDEKKSEFVVEKTGGPAESYDDFAAALPENDCRYAIYDFDFVTSENCQMSKIFFIAWSPSTSRIRAKMLYAMSKDKLRRELDGIHYEVQATDPTEMDLEVIRDRAH
ncbi:hypothetical protein HHK36_022544 [Tetracentron sinense]|uniref:ADF-H domain-containing protein n=1 Tax=Tetracentron sinense TaxID=13715 RepID=A0A834YPS4_TETSI|nr:hypothetical protein HHK36_022544 [Tetracentron sinense]